MKIFVPARIRRFNGLAVLSCGGLLALSGCSRSHVEVAAQPLSPPVEASHNTAADRVVEIDRLLALPLTGTPEESDRRAALRAERAALVASGQVPYELRNSMLANRPANPAVNNTVTRRSPDGNVVNYSAPTTRTEPITVAPNSQSTNLSYVEQMTPSERERYLKTIKAFNTQRVEFDVHRR